MSTTGILLLPPQPGGTSITSKLIEHLSRRFPDSEHKDFSLDHRLFCDTTSLLPGSDASQRVFTHIFASSHDPTRGFVRTNKSDQLQDGESITISAESIETFTSLVVTKLQPLWHPRQQLTVEDGVSVSLKNNEWILSIGDVRVAAKTPGTGMLRGTVVELHHTTTDSETGESDEQVTNTLFQDVLRKIFYGTGETFGDANFTIGETLPRALPAHEGKTADWELANIYMKVLRGQR